MTTIKTDPDMDSDIQAIRKSKGIKSVAEVVRFALRETKQRNDIEHLTREAIKKETASAKVGSQVF